MKQTTIILGIMLTCFSVYTPLTADDPTNHSDAHAVLEAIQTIFESHTRTVPFSLSKLIKDIVFEDLQENIEQTLEDIETLLEDPAIAGTQLQELVEALKYSLHETQKQYKEIISQETAFDTIADEESELADTRKKTGTTFCNLFVQNIVKVCGTLLVYGSITISPRTRAFAPLLIVNGNANINGTLTLGNLIVEDTTQLGNIVFDTVTATGDLFVGGTTTANTLIAAATTVDNLQVSLGALIGGTLAITTGAGDAITVNGTDCVVDFQGNTSTQDLTVDGPFMLPVLGNTIIQGTLTANGATAFQSTLSVTGTTTLNTFSTSGAAALNSLAVTNNATVGGTLSVTGNTTLSTVSTSGAATLNSLSVTNNATVGGTLGVTGNVTLSANLLMNNTTSSTAGVINKAGTRFIHNRGASNLFMGVGSGNFTGTGNDNACFGASSGAALTTGFNTTLIGSSAGLLATNSNSSVMLGAEAGGNTISSSGTYAGYRAGRNGSSVFSVVFLGANAALPVGANGSSTILIGNDVGTVFGGSSSILLLARGTSITSGTGNLFIGRQNTAGSITGGSNNIMIGTPGPAGAVSNQLYLGNSSNSSAFFLLSDAGAGTGVPANGAATVTLQINSSTGQVTQLASSARYKTNIRSMPTEMVDILDQLQPVTFNAKSNLDKTCYGLIAEDVACIDEHLVSYDAQGRPDGVHYQAISSLLIKQFQQHQKALTQHEITQNAISERIMTLKRIAEHYTAQQ